MSWTLIRHAIAMVMSNMSDALKASVVPFALVLIIGVIFPVPTFPVADIEAVDPSELMAWSQEHAVEVAFITLFTALVSVFAFSWVAVVWHRFILLEEYPNAVPAVNGLPIFTYIWRSFVLGLILMIAAIPVMMLAFPLIGILGGSSASPEQFSVSFLVVMFLVGSVMSFVWLRLAIVLPGVAIGAAMTFKQGWAETAPLAGAIFGAGVIIVAFNLIVGALLGPLFGEGTIVGLVVGLAVQWFTLMVGASMLTTLYGHLIEGRDLV